jgi:hypothetical protein
MSIDTAFVRLREANPVPEPANLRGTSDDVGALLATTRQRSLEMQTEIEAHEAKKMPKRGWGRVVPIVASVAVLAILAIVVANFVADPERDTASNEEELAVVFIEGDAETAVALLAADVQEYGVPIDVQELAAFRSWKDAIGRFSTVTECTESRTESAVAVSCAYTYEDALSEALGVGPFDGSRWDLVIVGGQIQVAEEVWDGTDYKLQAGNVFRQWLSNNHPDDMRAMIDFDSALSSMLTTPESIALWEKHTQEFIASLAE